MSCKCAARSLEVALAFVLLAVSAAGQSPARSHADFHWLEQKRDPRLWSKIQEAFAAELKPDDPGIVGPQAAMGHKFISRVGLEGASALVLIALQRDATTPKQAHFLVYNYDLTSQRKALIQAPKTSGVWQWHLVQLARFEHTLVPDIVFVFSECVECETQTLLASYRYDAPEKEWRWRNWEMGTSPHSGWTLPVGDSAEHGFDPEEQTQADYLYQTSCVYRIADLNSDGLDDVATWCRESVTAVEPPKSIHSVSDTTLLFSANDGAPKLRQIKDPAAASALHRQICSTQPRTPPCNSTESNRQADKSR